ncbi:sigma-54-dependent Fis family transcriptional regulator, partial [bacterium]|nr:sigma-54-dependent Fis family transcriptional regulator [bacterium]
ILPEHLPNHLRDASRGVPVLSIAQNTHPVSRTLEQIEMEHLLRVLEKHQGNKGAAAAELDISLKTLYNKLNKFQELEQRRMVG